MYLGVTDPPFMTTMTVYGGLKSRGTVASAPLCPGRVPRAAIAGNSRFGGVLGGLLPGAHDPSTGDLVYIGDVGTGFSDAARREISARLAPLERAMHPFAAEPPRDQVRGAQWVDSVVVGEVRYRGFFGNVRSGAVLGVGGSGWATTRFCNILQEVVRSSSRRAQNHAALYSSGTSRKATRGRCG
ncbi:ATP dependent DNA ligase [Allokutzneria oryzae]|uniref:DNA ligase (ATP) n=1 Tax=Allokutzneria oryzae TaxID=1378989 RepID=A0ABV5ZTK2_9PSEU